MGFASRSIAWCLGDMLGLEFGNIVNSIRIAGGCVRHALVGYLYFSRFITSD